MDSLTPKCFNLRSAVFCSLPRFMRKVTPHSRTFFIKIYSPKVFYLLSARLFLIKKLERGSTGRFLPVCVPT